MLLSLCFSLLSEHEDRIIGLTASPDGQMVASLSGDETIRIFNLFTVDQTKKKNEEKSSAPIFSLPRPIR